MAFQQTAVGGQLEFAPVSRVAGSLTLHATVDSSGRVSDARTNAGTFRGYENLLVDRDARDAIFISSRACGVCGGAHAITSALAMEMMCGVRPPHYGIAVRNVMAACDNMADNPGHLFTRVGPDYSEPVVRDTNPELWAKAQDSPAPSAHIHGYKNMSDIMSALTRFTGEMYREALYMSRIAREAFSLVGGKYPHPQTIVPGGLSATVDASDLNLVLLRVTQFLDYSRKVAAVWDDIAEFFYAADPRYGDLGVSPANFIDLGMWDDSDYYDGSYERSAAWGELRWATPGAVINGRVQTTNMQQIDTGIEEFVGNSFYEDWAGGGQLLQADPLGNPLSARHPWNKRTIPRPGSGHGNWSTAPRWKGNVMETGATARLYITAVANRMPHRGFLDPTGSGMRFMFPQAGMSEGEMEWNVPRVWNTLERNRARAYGLAQSTLVGYECTLIAFDLARIGGPEGKIFNQYKIPRDHVIGAGYWGGGRGYISHHVELDGRVIRNYQIVAPSSFMVSRDNSGGAGLVEQAAMATTSLSSQGHDRHLDLLRTVRSFDLCMSCASH